MTAFPRRALPADIALSSWVAPDGWRHRRFDWRRGAGVAPRGSILFQSGRADYVEKHLEPLAHWHSRGWRLSGFDWRGQGGSGRMLADAATGHLASLDRLVDDLAAFFADWRGETPPPHVLIGHSMGGHVALRLLAERGVEVDAAVLIAPMLGLNTSPLPGWAGRAITRLACRFGRAERRVWEQGIGSAAERAIQRRLTSCPERQADALWWKSQRPDLALGPPSWGWLAAAFASVAALAKPGVLEAVVTPVMLLGTDRDRLVSAAAIRRAARRLPAARLHMEKAAAHELLREGDDIRLPLMAAIDGFLDETAPFR